MIKNGVPKKQQSDLTMVQMLFPAHTAALTRNKEDAEALMQIAEIRNKVTGPIILSDIYLTYGGVTTVTIGASAVKAVATACLFNPISCNNAGIFIAEVGAGVSLANPAGAGKAVGTAATKAGQRYTFFNELGQMPRNGSRLVLNQGNAPTCAPTSCGMVLNTLGKSVNVHSLINEANVGTNGIPISKVAALLKNHDVNATFKNRMTIGDLEVATRNGKPAIVAVKQGGTGHAVVIDGVTNRYGVAVVAIRDPWGKQYFETVESFQKRFLNQGVTIK